MFVHCLPGQDFHYFFAQPYGPGIWLTDGAELQYKTDLWNLQRSCVKKKLASHRPVYLHAERPVLEEFSISYPVCLLQPKRVEKHRGTSTISSTASKFSAIFPLVSHYLDAIQADAASHNAGVLCFQTLNLLVEQFLVEQFLVQLGRRQSCHTRQDAKQKLHSNCGRKQGGTWSENIVSFSIPHTISGTINYFAMERKNHVAGQQTTATQNTRNYEVRILHEPLAHELTTVTLLETFDPTIALLRPKATPKKLRPMAQAIWLTIKEPLQWSFYVLDCQNPA